MNKKEIEVIVHFNKGYIQFVSVNIDDTVLNSPDYSSLPDTAFPDKSLKYFRISNENNSYVIAFNSDNLKWYLI